MGNYCITKYHSDEKLLKLTFHKGYWKYDEVVRYIYRRDLLNLHRLENSQYSLYFQYILQHDINNYAQTRVSMVECNVTKNYVYLHYGIPKKRINDIL